MDVVDNCVAVALLTANSGDLVGSIEVLESIVSIRIDVPQALNTLGHLYQHPSIGSSSSSSGSNGNPDAGATKKALKYLNILLDLVPNFSEGYASRSKLQLTLRQLDAALEDADKAISLITDKKLLAVPLINRAQIYIKKGLHSDAFIDLQEVIGMGAEFATPQAYFLLGQTEITFAHIQKAVEACKEQCVFNVFAYLCLCIYICISTHLSLYVLCR